MSSPADPSAAPDGSADVGLLSPVSAGTTVERLSGDRAVLAAMVRTEVALLRALVETGIAPPAAGAAADLVAGLPDLDPRRLALDAVDGGNPVIPLVRRLRAEVGEDLAGWVHFGATSQDVLDTALMLVAGACLERVDHDLHRLGDALAVLADRHRDTPAVARTLTQQALPTTFGLRVAGWLAGVHDAVRGLRTCRPLPVSLGGPVGSGASYGERAPAVADAMARGLGLAAPALPWHTRRTPVVHLAHALTVVGGACGKVAGDLLVLGQTEVGEVREGAGGPSSSMAHKANPVRSVLVAAAARQLPALGSVLGASMPAEQERPAGAWHAEWQPLRTMLRLAGAAAERTADLVPGLAVDTAAMGRNLDILLGSVGESEAWVRAHTDAAGVWVDRVVRAREEGS